MLSRVINPAWVSFSFLTMNRRPVRPAIYGPTRADIRCFAPQASADVIVAVVDVVTVVAT